jgi:hypothetical protein
VVAQKNEFQFSHRRVVAFFFLFATLFLNQINFEKSKAAPIIEVQKIRGIQVDQLDSTGCYKWTDELKPKEKMNSAKPAIFKAKVASKVSCREIHHFEIYIAITNADYGKTVARDSRVGKYCSRAFQGMKRYLVISKPGILPLSVSDKNAPKRNWCAVTGITYKDSASNSYFYYEPIYFPEVKINARN